MKYLRIFEKESDYTQYVGGGGDDYVTPHVALIKDNYDVKYQKYEPDYTNDYLTIEALEDEFNVTFTKNMPRSININNDTLYYSLDCNNWVELPFNTSTPYINAGDKIYFKGMLENASTNDSIGMFVISKRFNLSGNIMSMIFGDDAQGKTDLTGYNVNFQQLFQNTPVVNVSTNFLPATTLTEGCYNSMFYDCTSLVTAPELPATTLAPWCYTQMFEGCSSLVTAPELPATTLTENCYGGMFYNCTSLETAPELPATTLAPYCYSNMFDRCTSLTKAPELPATTLVESCYSGVFYGCTLLNYITMLATDISANSCLIDWVSGVSSTGTFVKNAAATWNVTGVTGIPSGWTIQLQ